MQFKASNSPIVHGFQAFYYELLKQKEICLSQFYRREVESSIEPNNFIENEGNSNEVEAMIVSVQKKLVETVNKIFYIISSKSRINMKELEEAKYIMVTLADEIFINIKWEGAKFWRFSLLEKQIFQTEISGEKFFTNLDELITNINSNINNELIFLYLMSLSLGFKGKYRDSRDAHEYLIWYKDKLYSMLHSKSSRLFYPGRTGLIEQCYEYTFMEKSRQSIPDTKFWTMCITGIIVLYIVISFAVWFGITDEINDTLNSISDMVRKGPLI